MNFQTYLENLRTRPEHKKKQFAFWSSFSFTAIVFVFWLATFSPGIGASNQTIAKTVEKAGTPSQSLVASVGSFFGDVASYFFKPKVIEYSKIQVVPGDR